MTCAVSGQKTPDGCYSLDRMLTGLIRHTFAYDTSTVNGAPGHPGRGLVKPGQPERSLAKMTDHLSRRVVRRSAPARCPRSRRR